MDLTAFTVEEGASLLGAVLRAAGEISGPHVSPRPKTLDPETATSLSSTESQLIGALESMANDADTEEITHRVVEEGGFELIAQLLKQYSGHAVVMRHIMTTLCRLTESSCNLPFALDSSILRNTVSYLQSIIHADLGSSSKSLFSSILNREPSNTTLRSRSSNMEQEAPDTPCLFEYEKDIVSDAVVFLGNLGFEDESRSMIRTCGGLNTLLAILKRYIHHEEIVDGCCYAMANFVLDSAENASLVIESAELPLIVECLRLHSDRKVLVESATGVLTNLCALEHSHIFVLISHGAIPALCKVMQMQSVSQANLIPVIRLLALFSSIPSAVPALVKEHAFKLVLIEMRKNTKRKEVLRDCLQTLLMISLRCHETHINTMIQAQAIDQLIALGASNLARSSISLQSLFLQCFTNLTTRFESTLDAPIIRSHLIPHLVETVQHFDASLKLQKLCLVLFSKLATDVTNALTIIEYHGLDVILRLLNHPESKLCLSETHFYISLACVCSLIHQATAPLLCHRYAIVRQITTLIHHRLDDDETVDYCIRALSRLSYAQEAAPALSTFGMSAIYAILLHHDTVSREMIEIVSTCVNNLRHHKPTHAALTQSILPLRVCCHVVRNLGENTNAKTVYPLLKLLLYMVTSNADMRRRLDEVDFASTLNCLIVVMDKEYASKFQSVKLDLLQAMMGRAPNTKSKKSLVRKVSQVAKEAAAMSMMNRGVSPPHPSFVLNERLTASTSIIRACQIQRQCRLSAPRVVEQTTTDDRASRWLVQSGAQTLRAMYTSKYYSQLCTLQEADETPFATDIAKDVHRTFPGPGDFQARKLHRPLKRLLCAYSLHCPESVGYCQSMNTIAGALLMVMEEHDAFWCFAAMIESRIGYYCKSMCSLMVDQRILEDLFESRLTTLANHFHLHDVALSSLTIRWFLCLFVQAPFQLDESFLLWDAMMEHGHDIVFHVAMAMLSHIEPIVLELDTQSDILTYMMNQLTSDLPAVESIVNGIHAEPLMQHVALLRQHHQQALLRERASLCPNPQSSKADSCFNEEERLHVWDAFTSWAPWTTLMRITLDNVAALQSALSMAMDKHECSYWKDHGLLSGLMNRLYDVLDTNQTGQIDYSEFLTGVFLFQKGSEEDKLGFAFRFFDTSHDGTITADELLHGITMLESTYYGAPAALDRSRRFIERRWPLTQDANPCSVLTWQHFPDLALTHPLIYHFFGLYCLT